MLQHHGSEDSDRKEALHAAGADGVRGHSGDYKDQNDGCAVRQQLDARQDNLVELTLSSPAPRGLDSSWHRAFGLLIESDVALSGLPPSTPAHKADIRVHLPSDQQFQLLELVYRSPYLDDAGEPILTVRRTSQPGFHFQYVDGTSFYLSETGCEVYASWPEGLTLEDTAVYLYGPILGFVLRLRGVVSLHASGVQVNGHAIALAGPPGAGKSTTAAALVQAGFRALTDDVFSLVDSPDGFMVQPAYPGIRLWPESVRHLWGSPDALPRLSMSWEKRYLNLENQTYAGDFQPVPLGAIYLLGTRTEHPDAPYFESAPSLVDLLANTYAGYALSPQMRGHEFDILSRLLSTVPVRKVIPHVDPKKIPALCQLIEKDATALCFA